MKKSFVALLMLAGISSVLCGCGDSSNQANAQNGEISQTQTISKSPIESLTSEEKTIFDALVIASDTFYAPQSMKVFDVKNAYGYVSVTGETNVDFDRYGPRCLIEISAENKMGGNTRKEYVLWTSEWGDEKNKTILYFNPDIYHENGTIIEYNLDNQKYIDSKNKRDFENVDVGNLNRALTQYWEEMGVF